MRLLPRLIASPDGPEAVVRAPLAIGFDSRTRGFNPQATIDLVRTLDAVVALGDFDSKRIGFLGLGLGARLGTTLLAHDDRPCAAVLARAASVAAPPAVDPDSTLALEMGSGAWPADARAFLASRLGF